MRNRTAIGILLLAVAGTVGGIYLVPSHGEIALMQLKDARFSSAMEHYSELYSQGDKSINVLTPLIDLHTHYGDVDKAIGLLEAYLHDHPRSLPGWKRLAELYKSSQR